MRLCSKKNYERKKYASRGVNVLQDVSNVLGEETDLRKETVLTIAELNSELQLEHSLNGMHNRSIGLFIGILINTRLDCLLQ